MVQCYCVNNYITLCDTFYHFYLVRAIESEDKQLVLNGHVFPSSYVGFLMSILVSKHIFSSMCQQQKIRGFLFSVLHTFYK
jgi:hypothetical protein